MRIAIVGGSLGGLFAATLLQRDGHRVTVLERSSGGLAGRGAGLVNQREIEALLIEVGRDDALGVGVVADERITLDRTGVVRHRQRAPQIQISWDNLHRTLKDTLEGDAYVLGADVRSLDAEEGGAVLGLSDGRRMTADLVIGADGIGSIVRRRVDDTASGPRYSGFVTWRGLVPETALPPRAAETLLGRFAFCNGPEAHALGYLVTGPNGEMERGRRRYNWVFYKAIPAGDLPDLLVDDQGIAHPFSLAPGQMPERQRERIVRDATRLLAPQFADAVRSEPKPFLQALFDYMAPRMTSGPFALLGDAAFLIRPHTAMGAAKAAGDAMALARHLRERPLSQALSAYDAERHPVGLALTRYGLQLAASIFQT